VKLLLDTNALLWWLADDPRLGRAALEAIAEPANDVLVSVASLWEIVVKLRIGKLEADLAAIIEALARDGISLIGIAPAHLAALVTLPTHHRDPFDHLLIAQSIAEGATFVSGDRHAAAYSVTLLRCEN
jgi:PIN domain nuclease of toxin-antitoxin system